ncbi:DUF6541 family protein [Saccharomonospora sp. NPDC046836]|uniref:DUF6541 family protein n=1 Tax=Saccharomonospora sp. NPDC046836 TaxID=3156921 RepID=UPI003410D77C
MPTSMSVFASAATIAVYLLVVFVPGLLAGALLGLRGWLLAGSAPLVTYAIAGLAGPWYALIGLPFNLGTFVVAVLICAAVAFAVGRRAPREPGGLWDRYGNLAVAGCVLLGAVLGLSTVLAGAGRLDAIQQGFDAVFHANGIRYIAETGDGGLTGMGTLNWYPDGMFYPNAYHLVGALVYQVTGAPVPAVLNANTVLLPGVLGLSLVTLVRAFRGRAVLAGTVPLVVAASSVTVYQAMRGPLLPYVLGLALLPIGAVALHRYLSRPAADTGLLLVLAATGLLTVHTSTLFGGILFALPVLLQRWFAADRARPVWRDLLALLPIAVLSALVTAPHLWGALILASGDYLYRGWPSTASVAEALGSLLVFQHFTEQPQVWLTIAVLLGVVFFGRLGTLRWLGGTAVLTGALFVAVATSDSPLVMALSRPWWDDPYRFIALASVPLCVLAAHGLAGAQEWLRERLSGVLPWRKAAGFALSALVLGAFAVGSGGLYARANAAYIGPTFGNKDTFDPHVLPVTRDEAAAMLELGRRAGPGEWAMNDRTDGTVWTYAVGGVRSVAAHFDGSISPPDAVLLANYFREYQTNVDVRAAVRRLNVRWVILGQHGYPANAPRATGLIGLDQLPFLELVYRNADAAVYRLIPEPGELG